VNNYYDAHLKYMADLCAMAKESGVTLIELHADGKPKRIEFGRLPMVFDLDDTSDQQEPGVPAPGASDPSEYESALTRMASGKRKGKAQ
jgi:hypothetical protein